MLRFELLCIRAVELTFFCALAGCASCVVLSWISIFSTGFSNKGERPPVESPPLEISSATAYSFHCNGKLDLEQSQAAFL
jgi:hypothetical protein